MQIVSLGKRLSRGEIHARAPRLQPWKGGGAIAFGLVDRLHREPHALLIPIVLFLLLRRFVQR
jgi:hypothetical protein